VRIAIDARKLHDYGIGTYVRNLLRHLARLDSVNEYVVVCRPDDREHISTLGANFRPILETAPTYSVREQYRLPLDLRREHPQVFHAPHYVLPPLTPCRSVVTIHDVIHLRFPEYLPNRLAHAYARGVIWAAIRRSTRILTVSEASKRDLLRFFNVSAAKIEVIPNAIDERFGVPPSDEEVALVQERYQLRSPFLLYAGNIKPHKNIERLIEAFADLRRRGLEDVKLLIIGDHVSRYPALRRAVHRCKLHRHVRFFGFVPDRMLAVLYRLADVFVFPSLYEGFGLPPLEAMASGTPVVTSDLSALPEVVGDAALLVDPYDTQAIADALERVLKDPALRRDLIERGLTRAREFSWERSVQRIREVYQEVGQA
jgi:glycosyltransferase involved in cell wall biosynthesis